VDHQIGRLETFLSERGLADNLVTIFIADHGSSISDHYCQVKGPFDTDDIAHIPFIIRYPGVFDPHRYPYLTQSIDFLPTLGDIIRRQPIEPVSGKSLIPALEGDGEPVHDEIFSEGSFPTIHKGIRESIRTERFLYTRYPSEGESELFELNAPSGQRENAGNRLPDAKEKFDERLDAWRLEHPIGESHFGYVK